MHFQASLKSTIRHLRMTVEQNIQLMWQQTESDLTLGQRLASDENSACQILSDMIHCTMVMSKSVIQQCLSGSESLATNYAVVAFSFARKDFGRVYDNSFPASVCFCFYQVEISSCTLIPLFRQDQSTVAQ